MSNEPYHPQPWEASLEAVVRPKQKISRLQLAVYLTYKGDVDVYQIRKSPDPAMFDDAWGTIGALLQHLSTVASDFASENYHRHVETELNELTEDGETRELLGGGIPDTLLV
jgi:hypothetical protein